jgi:(p)ppGpp synthase/HD superfamily hydrolase
MKLEDAIAIASLAHCGQVDKAGQPYILHPLRVMLQLTEHTDRVCAVLHDMIEDTNWSLAKFKVLPSMTPEILAVLDLLTHRGQDTYDQYIDRIMANKTACWVKLADLEDNMDLKRLPEITDQDQARHAKYRAAHARISVRLTTYLDQEGG